MTADQIENVYTVAYGVFGDTPPFNKAQFYVVMRNLSTADAAFVLSVTTGGTDVVSISKVLRTNGLAFDSSFPLD